MAALLTYRSRDSFESRFGRKVQPSPTSVPPSPSSSSKPGQSSQSSTILSEDSPGIFSAQSYLRYQGDKFVNRFDANCYIAITRMLDTHDVSRGRGEYFEVLKSIQQPSLVIGISLPDSFHSFRKHGHFINLPFFFLFFFLPWLKKVFNRTVCLRSASSTSLPRGFPTRRWRSSRAQTGTTAFSSSLSR
jgi:hypothetical protein